MTEPDNRQPVDQDDGPDNQAPANRSAAIEANLKSARSLSTVSTIAGPISFIIGGMALSTVALVCGIISLNKTRRILESVDDAHRVYALALRQTAIIGIAIGAIALIVNAIGVALMVPVLMEVLQTGDYSSLLGDGVSAGGTSGGGAWG